MIKVMHSLINIVFRIVNHYESHYFRSLMGHCDSTAIVSRPVECLCPAKLFLYENTNIYSGAKFIISPDGEEGRFIMKKNSGSAQGLTVITQNHGREVGREFKNAQGLVQPDLNKNADVIVEQDVWIGANVTLCAGVTIGRGATIGAGAVVRSNIPPYSVVIGNPAKIVGFSFTPSEIIEHEKKLFPEDERLTLSFLEKNYNKYFIEKIKDIKQFTKL